MLYRLVNTYIPIFPKNGAHGFYTLLLYGLHAKGSDPLYPVRYRPPVISPELVSCSSFSHE